jgi:ferredoxin
LTTPVSKLVDKDQTQRILYIDSAKCDFCGTCVGVCSGDAIELTENHISIDQEQCTLCGDCIVVCPLRIPEILE